MLNLSLSFFYRGHISIMYNFVTGDNLDKDKRGSDEQTMTDMLSFLPIS